MKRFYVFVLCLVLIIPVGLLEIGAEQAYFFVGQEKYAPFNLVDAWGNLTGLDVEIIKKAAEVAGVKVKIDVHPWAGTLKMVRNGKADGVFGCGKKPREGKRRMRYFHAHSSNWKKRGL